MKHAKKLFALLLACAMAFGVGVAAFATGETPHIITQPQEQHITHGESCELSVEVYIPAGWAAEYQWVIGTHDVIKQTIQDATQPSLHLSPKAPFYPPGKKYYSSVLDYFCIITLRNGDGTVLRLDSHPAPVWVEPTVFLRIVGYILGALEFLTFPFRFLFYIFFAWE